MAPLKTTPLSTVKPADISWLWQGRIPFGALTILEGNGGLGKSYISLEIAAGVSRGKDIDGNVIDPGGVILMAAEDDVACTLVPRLNNMKADLSRVHMFNGEIDLRQNLADIEHVIISKGVRLIIVDPLSYYMGASIKSEQKIREVLTPLVQLATQYQVAVVLIRHLTKGKGKRIDNGIGGVAIAALCRTGLVLERKDGEKEVTVINFKNNLAPQAGNVTYSVVDGRVKFAGSAMSVPLPPVMNEDPSATMSAYRKALCDNLDKY